MPLELWNTFATFGTFFVIAATAVVAIIQLRHARGSNQIAGLNELRETTESAEMQTAMHFVAAGLAEKLKDAQFRYEVAHRVARTSEAQALIRHIRLVGNFYEGVGVLVKEGLVDRRLVLEMWCAVVCDNWEKLAPVATILRRDPSGKSFWVNFEYLTVLSQDWLAAHSGGTYPPNMRRIELEDDWLDADRRYDASLATT